MFSALSSREIIASLQLRAVGFVEPDRVLGSLVSIQPIKFEAYQIVDLEIRAR